MRAVFADTEAAEQDGKEDQSEGRGGDEPANHHDRERSLDFRARSIGKEQRHQSERSDARRHHHRTQTADGTLEDNVLYRHTGGGKLIEVADEDQPIQHGNTK